MIRRLTPRWRTHATIAALVLPPLVQFFSIEKIADWIDLSRSAVPPDDGVDDRALAAWVDRVLAKLPPPWRRTCLRRAVVLQYLLQRCGRPTALHIGVKRDSTGTLLAHAWLTRGDQLYLEPGIDQASSYQVITTLPTRREQPT